MRDVQDTMRKIIRRSPRLVVLSSIVALAAVSCGSDSTDSTPLDSLPPVSEVSEPVTDPSVPGTDPAATVPDGEPGDQSAEDVAADTVVFVWTESGGCQMAGPNCGRYEITTDGTVEAYRLGLPDEATAEPAATGQVDPDRKSVV